MCKQLVLLVAVALAPSALGANVCTGASKNLKQDQCDAWGDLFTSTGGERGMWDKACAGPTFLQGNDDDRVTATKTDPCACRTPVNSATSIPTVMCPECPAKQHLDLVFPICNKAATVIQQMCVWRRYALCMCMCTRAP